MDAGDWDRRYADRPWLWSAEPNVFLVSEVGSLAPGLALDLGCGEGRNAVWLAERGWTVTAVDFSRVALQRARELAEQRKVEVDWVLADLAEYQPAVEAFDLVTVLYFQLPAPALRAVLGRAVAALRPGGTLLALGHDRSNLERGYGGPPNPEVLWERETMIDAVAPLQLQRAEVVDRAVDTDEGMRVAKDLLVRGVRTDG